MSIRKAVLIVLAGMATVALAFGVACGGSDDPTERDSRDRDDRRAERATRRASEESRPSPAPPVSGSGFEPTALPKVEPTADPSNRSGSLIATPEPPAATVEVAPTEVPTLAPTATPTQVPTLQLQSPWPGTLQVPTLAPIAIPTQVPTPTPSPYSGPLLRQAVFEGNRERVEELLNLGEDVNATDSNGKTPLYLAAEQGNPDIAALLLSWNAYLAAPEGWKLLHVVALVGDADMGVAVGPGCRSRSQGPWWLEATGGSRGTGLPEHFETYGTGGKI